MYFLLTVTKPDMPTELTTHESWGDLMDAIDGMDYYMSNGTVSSFTISQED